MKNKKYIFLIILLMAVGFASVSTTLYINNKIGIKTNEYDFEVFFSDAYVNGFEDSSVIKDTKHIVFETTLKSIGDTYTLDYDVTNGSKNYDANVTIECSGGNDYVSVNNNWVNPTFLEATDTKSGTLTATLVKSYTGDTELKENVVCTIVATAEERIDLGVVEYTEGIKLYDLVKSKSYNREITDFNTNSYQADNAGVYYTNDTNSGKTVYYYRGNMNNYVVFNNMCWRIVRTTETEGVKMIYAGVSSNNQCNDDRRGSLIGQSTYNYEMDDNTYVGYMYGNISSDNYDDTHENINSSDIKTYVDNWFVNNITDQDNLNMIEDTVYCNDRSVKETYTNTTTTSYLSTPYNNLGYGNNYTLFGGVDRVSKLSTNLTPSLKCNYNDSFTVDSANGNGALTYPVGMITEDEAIYSGLDNVYNSNTLNKNSYSYLSNGFGFWTMTPVLYNGNANVSYIDDVVNNRYATTRISLGVRPVISLKNGALIDENNGNGTYDNPYIITGLNEKKQVEIPVNLYETVREKSVKEELDFNVRSGVSNTNGVYTTTENDKEVYYYRGNVDNNIIFNNMCWKIVRTTDTLGTKLLYNGIPSNGKCDYTDGIIGETPFNKNSSDNTYVGYMYGVNIKYIDRGRSAESSREKMQYTATVCDENGNNCSYPKSLKNYFGTEYTFDTTTGLYKPAGTVVEEDWSSSFVGYYTCGYGDNECRMIYYISEYYNENYAYAYSYNSTYTKTTSYGEAHENNYDSDIKTYIDNWYSTNFVDNSITSKIADTVYCNDRSTVQATNTVINGNYLTLGYGSNYTTYGAIGRSSFYTTDLRPSLNCINNNDKFTVSNSIGNGKLTYPVGLITSDETIFAGFNSTTASTDYMDTSNYLITSKNYWTMTPFTDTNLGAVNSTGLIKGESINSTLGVRPVITLKNDVKITGKGTTNKPYKVFN